MATAESLPIYDRPLNGGGRSVSLPAFMQYVNPLLATLRKLGGAGRPPRVFQSIARELALSNAVLSERLSSGGSRFENQVAWARWYLVNAGFIDGSRRGVWKLTERGWASEFLSEDALQAVFDHTQSRYRGAGEEAEEEETPETTADEMDVEKLKELYASDTAAQRFLDHAAGRQRNQSETTVDRALQILRNDGHHVTRQEIISVFQSLENCGCGRFVAGRRGWPSRFVWSTAMISVGRAATGEQEDVEELEEETTEAVGEHEWIAHSFHLRPDLTVEFELPVDLTAPEAARIARFVEALPFGDS
ncbi:MAG: winged helix-turn-helix domain-containing protein [Planctomycetes bacterium]|nr:winged helix-turn-helix domain-containing protein [Planctomycetota bacterium]